MQTWCVHVRMADVEYYWSELSWETAWRVSQLMARTQPTSPDDVIALHCNPSSDLHVADATEEEADPPVLMVREDRFTFAGYIHRNTWFAGQGTAPVHQHPRRFERDPEHIPVYFDTETRTP